MAGEHRWAVVLAGGDGTRLRELTRLLAGRPIPKQYCRITGDRSLLEATLARVHPLVPPERTLVIINRDHLDLAGPQLVDIPAENRIVQPRNCDTGPGVLLCLLRLAARCPDAPVYVFPSDHFVADENAFRRHAGRTADLLGALPDRIALLGIQPDHVEAGYGYIEPGPSLAGAEGGDAFHVIAFREKPSVGEASELQRRGALWNSFVLAFRVRPVLQLLARLRPDDVARMRELGEHPEQADTVYRSLPSWNFSHGLLACVPERLVVLRAADTGWSDWGTRQAIERTFAALRRHPPWHDATPAHATG
jgi:mannose-1-phosphate guanylyltransferase